jgi:hypothetical protein
VLIHVRFCINSDDFVLIFCICIWMLSLTAPIGGQLLCHVRGLEARLPPPAPRHSLCISFINCKGHTAPSCTTSLPIISYMGWPRGTNFSQLHCAAISTVDHPLGSTSLYTGSWCQTAPSCTTSLTIWLSIRSSLMHSPAPHVSPYYIIYRLLWKQDCPSLRNTLLRIISSKFV